MFKKHLHVIHYSKDEAKGFQSIDSVLWKLSLLQSLNGVCNVLFLYKNHTITAVNI